MAARKAEPPVPVEEIPALITTFMNQEVRPGMSMRHYLYLALPEALDCSNAHYRDTCAERLAELQELTGNARLLSLKLEDGSLDRAAEWIDQTFGEFYFGPADRADVSLAEMGLDIYRRGYHAGMERKAFLQDQLLPILKQLEQGQGPTQQDYQELGDGLTPLPPQLVSVASGLLAYYMEPGARGVPADRDLTPENPKKTERDIREFLGQLWRSIVVAKGGQDPSGQGVAP